jgi:ribonuclease Y
MSPIAATVLACAALIIGLSAGIIVWRALARRANEARLAAAIEAEKARLAAAHLESAKQQEARAAETLNRHRAAVETELAGERTRLKAEAEAQGRARAERDERDRRLERREAQAAALEAAAAQRAEAATTRTAQLDASAAALEGREARLRQVEERLRQAEAELLARGQALEQRGAELDARQRGIEAELARVAGLTPDQARAELMLALDQSLMAEQAERIARHEKDLLARARELAIEHVSRAIQRYAAEHTAETTTAKVPIANEELKGRVIGKEGRNIKAFELATGADIIIDDAPDHILISCFDPIRREIARRSLLTLLEDGRIHPGRIEEVLGQVQQDLEREGQRLGEDAAFACEVSGLHPQVIKLLGKLHFRTSYGQNVLKHTQEVAFLCGAMAADLGLDPKLGRRCGLLHDVGKAIDHEQEGSHPQLGYEALKRYGEGEIVANAALAHHEGHAVLSAYTVLAAAADAISAARPGARRDNHEVYVKRLQQLEEIACSFKGVQKAYAIQAGRELRVIVNGHTLADEGLAKVARDIAKRIEDEVAFPGEIRVTMIRETRAMAVAR